MAANISTNFDGSYNFISRRDVPVWWGGSNKVFDSKDNMDMIQATEQSGLGTYEVVTPCLIYNGEIVETDNWHILRVEPSGKAIELGTVDKDYSLLQNNTIAQIFNPISKEFPVLTMGGLDKGRKVFWCLDGGLWEVKSKDGRTKHPMQHYVCIVDNKVAKEKTYCFIANICIVCQNTQVIAQNTSAVNVGIRHWKGNELALESVSKTLLEMQQSKKTVEALFGQMTQTHYTTEDFKKLLSKKLFPAKKVKGDTFVEVTENGEVIETQLDDIEISTQDTAQTLGLFNKFNGDYPSFANTTYAAYNALTEKLDWTVKRGPQNPIGNLFGKNAKVKEMAFAELIKVA